jgi:hypothetical protein
MSLKNPNFKKYRVLTILILSITLFNSMILVTSAATTYELPHPSGEFTFKFIFPNGDVVGYDPAYHVEGRGDYVQFLVDTSPENKQNGVYTIIEVEGVDTKGWSLLKRGYPIKRTSNSTNEFMFNYILGSDYDELKYATPNFYSVQVSSEQIRGYRSLTFFLMAAEDNKEDFFIVPADEEIEFGETIDFTLKKERNGIISDVDDSDVKWDVAQSLSISDYKDNVIIGTIDNAGLFSSEGGLFTSQDIGTCTISAKIDKKTVAKTKVVVKCPCDKEADLEEVIRLYKQRIPEGPYQTDLKAGNEWTTLGFSPGAVNNMYSVINSDYGEFTCGGYQAMVLEFLHNIQSTPDECHLLNGYDFSPIAGSFYAHHAVVVYPVGTFWKQTGVVFDPWVQQKPEVMSISEWERMFFGAAGDKLSGNMNSYNITNSNEPVFFDARDFLVGSLHCPVNILITDSSGRQLGAVNDNEMAFDIPDASLLKMSDGEGGNQWYFTLPTTDEYDVDITAFDDGDFEFFVMNSNTEQLQDYGKNPIQKGETAEVELSSEDPTSPMKLPDRSEVIPTQETLVVPEVSASSTVVKEKGLPGFEIWVAVSMVFLIMLVRKP